MIDLKIPTAVLIIDVQNVMFDMPVLNSEEILKKIKDIEDFAIQKNLPLIYLQHAGTHPDDPEQYGTEPWKLHPSLKVQGPVIGKTELDAFATTSLNDLLKEKGIKQIIICGMQSEFCITANSKSSAELGYKTLLVKDAHSTYNPDSILAQKTIDGVNQNLADTVQLIKTQDLH